jgi:hypothetical protein
MPTSDDLMRLARACADQITPPRKTTHFPSFAEVEEQCGDGYEELLAMLHEEELFQPADLDEQERLVDAIKAALGASGQDLIEQLVDNQAAQVWLQQEGAFHLGVAVGLRLAEAGYTIRDEDEPEPLDEIEEEEAMRFGRYRYDPVRDYDEDEEGDEDEEEGGGKR